MAWWDPFYNVGAGLARDIPAAVNWFGQQASKSPEQAQADVRGAAYGIGHSLATLPQRAFGASEMMRTEGTYNPEPIVEAATLPMGTGAVAGVPAAAGEAVLGAGILRRKVPPLIGGYHGTGSPTEFAQFKAPPITHDIGIHGTIDPNVSAQYSRNKPSFEGSLKHLNPEDLDYWSRAHARTVPITMDVQSALKFPVDAGKWNVPENVIEPLAQAISKGKFEAPRGILSDMENIAGSQQMWQEQISPMLKDRGYDSVFYPHGTDYGRGIKYNTFMTLDPEQILPRFSPGGQKLIGERGIHEPMKVDPAYTDPTMNWRVPSGILKKIEESEAPEVGKAVKEKIHKSWEEKYQKEKMEALRISETKAAQMEEMFQKYKAGIISFEDYINSAMPKSDIP